MSTATEVTEYEEVKVGDKIPGKQKICSFCIIEVSTVQAPSHGWTTPVTFDLFLGGNLTIM